jgi:hypothetical protein
VRFAPAHLGATTQKGFLAVRKLSAVRLTEGLSATKIGMPAIFKESEYVAIPPSRLRRATSLYTREALPRLFLPK